MFYQCSKQIHIPTYQSYCKFVKWPNVKDSTDFLCENTEDCFMNFFLGLKTGTIWGWREGSSVKSTFFVLFCLFPEDWVQRSYMLNKFYSIAIYLILSASSFFIYLQSWIYFLPLTYCQIHHLWFCNRSFYLKYSWWALRGCEWPYPCLQIKGEAQQWLSGQ